MDEMVQEQLTNLRRTLAGRFNRGELRDLCFDLGVDFDSLPGAGTADKGRELVAYFARRHRVPKLAKTIEELRPDIQLREIPFDTEADPAWVTTHKGMQLTGCGSTYLRKLANDGRVKARKEGGKWYFDREILLAYVHGWIGTEEASELTDYTAEHIRWLAREGLVRAEKVSGVWLLHKESLLAYARFRGQM